MGLDSSASRFFGVLSPGNLFSLKYKINPALPGVNTGNADIEQVADLEYFTCMAADEAVVFFIELEIVAFECSNFNCTADKMIQQLNKKAKGSDPGNNTLK